MRIPIFGYQRDRPNTRRYNIGIPNCFFFAKRSLYKQHCQYSITPKSPTHTHTHVHIILPPTYMTIWKINNNEKWFVM